MGRRCCRPVRRRPLRGHGCCCRQPGEGPLAAVPFGAVSDDSGATALRNLRPRAARYRGADGSTAGARHRVPDRRPDPGLSRRSRAAENSCMIAPAHARRNAHKLGRPVGTGSTTHHHYLKSQILSVGIFFCAQHGRTVDGLLIRIQNVINVVKFPFTTNPHSVLR